jgi:hypothetical protein
MASYKVSELTAVTSTDDASLIYVADTQDSGTSFSGRKITRGNLFSGIATETYVTTAISNLVDGAPAALDTLNELAAALGDDDDVAASLTALINANETHVDNMATLTGAAKDATNLGAFSGVTISDNATIKAALQALETSVESKGSGASLTSLTTAVGDLNALTGVAQNDEDLGTFTGSTLPDSQTVKSLLQTIETSLENISAVDTAVVDAGDNVNRLVASTSADSEPAVWKFLAVDCSDGSIKVLDKSFVEVD